MVDPPLIPDAIGDGYVARTVYAGHCVVPGCTTEALIFCAEHDPRAMIDENTLLHLCRTHFDRYADKVKGKVALAVEFTADAPSVCGVCGVGVAEGGYFAVHRQAYVGAMGPIKQEEPPAAEIEAQALGIVPTDDPVAAEHAPKVVYEGEELRIVLSGNSFIMEVPELDAMRERVWKHEGGCAVEGRGIDARACRALLRLQEQYVALACE